MMKDLDRKLSRGVYLKIIAALYDISDICSVCGSKDALPDDIWVRNVSELTRLSHNASHTSKIKEIILKQGITRKG